MYVKGRRKGIEICYSVLYIQKHFIYCSYLLNEMVWEASEFSGVYYKTF